MLLIGIVAAIILSAGLLPPYFELWKRGGRVVGISQLPLSPIRGLANIPVDWLFLSIDWLGCFLSLISLGK